MSHLERVLAVGVNRHDATGVALRGVRASPTGVLGIQVGKTFFVGDDDPHVNAVRAILRELVSRLTGKDGYGDEYVAKRNVGSFSYHGTYDWTQQARMGSSDVYRPRITAKDGSGSVNSVLVVTASEFGEVAGYEGEWRLLKC